MIQSTLTAFKEYILSTNTYFSKGFDDVYLDDTQGIVAGKETVFPNDKHGNYFYLRLPNSFRFDYNTISRVTDCASSPGITGEVSLVALVRNGNADNIVTNLLNTIVNYNSVWRIRSAMYRSEDVVLKELAKMGKDNIVAALARLGNQTIVSITFEIDVEFRLRKMSTTCILDVCNC